MKKYILLIAFFTVAFIKAEKNLISSILVDQKKISIIPGREYKEQFGDVNFFVEYDIDELDLTKLPYSILTLPFIAHALPIILRSGETFYVEEIDADFNAMIPRLQRVLRSFYPHLAWAGNLIGRKVIPYSFKKSVEHEANKKGIVSPFSGGIDSMYNSLASLDKKQLLVTVYGGDVPLSCNEMWSVVQEGCKNYCATWGCQYASVKSNFSGLYGQKNAINPPSLWTMAGQSLSYSGLVAPLTIAKGYPFILIGSAVTEDLALPYGSHPLLDHFICYAGVHILHFGGECTRMDKIKFILKTAQQHQKPAPHLRVCWEKKPQGKNCCECINKCLPTIHGLLAEGADPRRYGFTSWTPDGMIKVMKEFFEQEKIMHIDRAFIWTSIKNRIQEQLAAGMHFESPLDSYFTWLSGQDFMQRVDKNALPASSAKEMLKDLFNKSMAHAYNRYNGYFAALG